MGEISLKDYFLMLKKRLWLIIILTVIPIAIVGVIGFYGPKTEPGYEVSTNLLVGGPKSYLNKSNEGQMDYHTYKAINGKLVAHFNELIKMEVVADEVINNLGLDISYKDFSEKLNVTLIDNTEIIKVELEDNNPELAIKIVNEIVAVSSEKAKEIIGIENIEVIDKVQAIEIPVESRTKTNMAIAGILGFIISIFLVFLFEYMDNTIKTPKDIETHLDLHVTGIIPETKESLIAYKEPKSFAAETYKAFGANIQSFKTDKGIKSILITSSTPNEGKSIISLNTAITIAQAGEKVLLIDGNLRKPKIHTYFDIDNNCGLSNILNENIDYRKAIHQVEIEKKLHILTSGTIPSNPVELLATKRMKDLLEEARKEYDTVIIDAPSLGAIADAIILSTIADGTILVCATGETNIDEIKVGKELLEKANTNILGVVLNKVLIERDNYYKYYYDSYLYYKVNSTIEKAKGEMKI